jgi:hypothetical protein
MLKKILNKLLGGQTYGKPYRKYSSSDYRYRDKYPPHHGHGHSHYGHPHYKKRKSSRSFFSS